MAAIAAGLIIFFLFCLGMTVCFCLGLFNDKPTYNAALRKRLAQNIYAEQMLAKQNDADLAQIPENIVTKLLPFTSTRYWVKQDLKKMGLRL